MYIHFLTRSLDPAGPQLAATIGLRVSVVVDLSVWLTTTSIFHLSICIILVQ